MRIIISGLKGLIFTGLITFSSMSMVIAQDEIVVDNGSDLFTVISDVMDENGMLSTNIFVLKRGAVYFMSQSIFTNDDITLRGEEGDEAVRPAMVIPKAAPDGNYVSAWFTIEGEGKTFKATDIIFQMLTLQAMSTGINVNTLVVASADNQRIILDRCIINGNGNNVIASASDGQYVKITNCRLRNNRNLSDDWSGGFLYGTWSHGTWRDSLIFKNNTLINIGNTGLRSFTGATSRAVIVDHNTFFGITRNPLYATFQSNVQITNNMFFAPTASGEPKSRGGDPVPVEIFDSTIVEAKDTSSSVFFCHMLSAAAYPHVENVLGFNVSGDQNSIEEQRTYIIKNNCVYWPPELVAAWDTIDEDGGKQKPLVIAGRVANWLFENQINTVFENTYGHKGSEDVWTSDFDPGYDQATIERVITPMNTWIDGFRNEEGWTPFMVNIDDPGKEVQLAWPLPENLAYTNEVLLTGGTDGLPVGDLNWFPEVPSGVKEAKVSTDFSLSSFPNPFSSHTTIKYRLDQRALVKLSVYNMVGKEVVVLVNQLREPGQHHVDWSGTDASGNALPAGMYLYQLEVGGNGIAFNKLIML